MAKLYPPSIEGKLPAQCQGRDLIIPYQLSRAVGFSDFISICLKIKNINSNEDIGILETQDFTTLNAENIYNAKFKLSDDIILKVGQYYKAQIAFKNTAKEVGFYSTVGVFKYTAEPKIEISNLTETAVAQNQFPLELQGLYTPPIDDPMEKAYSYKFDIYDNNGTLIESSGEIFESTYEIVNGIQEDRSYTIQLTVISLNDLHSTASYSTRRGWGSLEDWGGSQLIAIPNEDDGCNVLYLTIPSDPSFLLNGSYRIERKSSAGEWLVIHKAYYFIQPTTPDGQPGMLLYKDYTIEQGIAYTYYLYKYNEVGQYSIPLDTEEIPCINNFQDIFLYDGKRQLKIQYNPKVSSFKNVIMEQKNDTLGGIYPFFTRNGNKCYKEFTLGGLISTQMDNNHLFVSTTVKGMEEREKTPAEQTITLIDPYMSERLFKLQVLNWLNDGKVKLFRSPTEGNYLVKLMNISLTPEDTLGRMLHSFTCTAYEVASITYKNLSKYKISSTSLMGQDKNADKAIVKNSTFTGKRVSLTLNTPWIRFTAPEGTEFEIKFAGDIEKQTMFVGVTGVYEIATEDLILQFTAAQGTLQYLSTNLDTANATFNTIYYLSPSNGIAPLSEDAGVKYDLLPGHSWLDTDYIIDQIIYIRITVDEEYVLKKGLNTLDSLWYQFNDEEPRSIANGEIILRDIANISTLTLSPGVIADVYGRFIQGS